MPNEPSFIKNISVVYLAWIPLGIDKFKSFIESYSKYIAGTPHSLYILFNGVTSSINIENYYALIKEKLIPFEKIILEKGQDIDAYFYAATEIKSHYVIFLNTYTTFLADNWLKKYVESFIDGVGIIASSGSYQSYYSSVFQKNTWKWEIDKSLIYNYRKYKLFIKAYFYWRLLFKPFPNAHIRTNAFMVEREVFLKFYPGKINTKFKAYLFENGRKSLTNKYLQKGYKVLIIDKDGKTYEPSQWTQSKTFWISNQENLLVSDNQTRLYEEANDEEKKQMTYLAWGIK